jgi:anaerobic selenocysteine-containing dehydrogenase
MAAARRLVLSPGNGLERGRNGGSGVRAVIALPALMGKLDRENGIVLAARRAFPTTPDRLTRPDLGPDTRTLNIKDIGRHLATDDIDPPLRALFIYNHNPIVVHPDQNRMKRALARADVFLVGIEIAMTESMQQCDIVLPAATHFECHDLYAAYGHHWLQRAEPVIPPPGEALPNTEIFRRLAARFGFTEDAFTASDQGADRRCGRRCGRTDARHAAERDPRSLADGGQRGTAARAVRQCHAGDAVGQGRACVGCAGQALGRGGAAACIPAAPG